MSLITTLSFIASHPLNRERKLASLVRFAKWQIGSRLVPGPVLYEWVNGAKVLIRPGETGLTQNIYTGLQDYAEMAYCLHVLREGDLFLDVGANLGSYTILACAAIGARALAFEPVPSTYARLVENIRLNNLNGRVHCFNIALGGSSGKIGFTAQNGNNATTNHALAPGEWTDAGIEVQVATLDSMVCETSPMVLKVDVEGFEMAVLEGASGTLKNPNLHSIIMELNGSAERYGYSESDILERIQQHGFDAYSYSPEKRQLKPLEGKCDSSGNTLFIRDKNLVMQRLKSAPRFRINGSEI